MAWIAAWLVALAGLAVPWRVLGGLVDERLRWVGWLVLATGLQAGLLAGRDEDDDEEKAESADLGRRLRWLLYPPVAAATVAYGVLAGLGADEGIGLVTTAVGAYVAGLALRLTRRVGRHAAALAQSCPWPRRSARHAAWTDRPRPRSCALPLGRDEPCPRRPRE
jgi:hypothetical protein